MRKKKIVWNEGDYFTIQLSNKKYVIGQVLDKYRPNIARIVLFNEISDLLEKFNKDILNRRENVICALSITIEQLDYGIWPIVGNSTIRPLHISEYPNEKYRVNNWIGSKTYDAGLLEDFAESYFGLNYWDRYFDPEYFDKMLYNKNMKPTNLKYK